MAKYATLKAERDDAVERAIEAERLSNKAVVEDLEQKLAQVTRERDEARMWSERMRKERDECKDFIREFTERSTQFTEGY